MEVRQSDQGWQVYYEKICRRWRWRYGLRGEINVAVPNALRRLRRGVRVFIYHHRLYRLAQPYCWLVGHRPKTILPCSGVFLACSRCGAETPELAEWRKTQVTEE